MNRCSMASTGPVPWSHSPAAWNSGPPELSYHEEDRGRVQLQGDKLKARM